MWKHIFITHTRLQSLLMSLCGNTYVFTCSGSVKSRNTCAFHANLLPSSLKQQEMPGFEVMQRHSLCYHISAAAMLPVKLMLFIPIYWYNFNMTYTSYCTIIYIYILKPCYKIKCTTYKMLCISRHNFVYIYIILEVRFCLLFPQQCVHTVGFLQ